MVYLVVLPVKENKPNVVFPCFALARREGYIHQSSVVFHSCVSSGVWVVSNDGQFLSLSDEVLNGKKKLSAYPRKKRDPSFLSILLEKWKEKV